MNTVVVPVVAGPQMTKRAIDSALAQDIETQVLVICNGAVSGLPQYLTARYWNNERVQIIAYATMRSLNAVWNFAIGQVLARAPHVLVINNDVELRTDTYRLLAADGGTFVTGVSVGTREEMEQGVDTTSKRPHPDFSCFLIRRECWSRVGGFDEAFFAYASDADYHLRMDKAGVDAYSLAIPFYHERSSTIKLVSNELRDTLQARADADRLYFRRKYGFDVGSDQYYHSFRNVSENRYAKEGVL